LETTSNDYSRADGFTMIGEVSATIAARFGNSRNNHEECVAQPAWPADVAPTLAQCRSGSGSPGYSNQELFSQGAGNLIPQPVPYDLFQITAPVNRQNRQPGDPCHTLARDNAAHAAVVGTIDMQACKGNANVGDGSVSPTLCKPSGNDVHAVAFAQNQVGEVRVSDVTGTINTNSNASGRNTPMAAVAQAVETLQQQGYNGNHASTQEADAVATLRVLRDEIGEEAFTAWGLGILDSLQPSQVLRARLHGDGIRCASFSRSWPIDCAISRSEDRATWAVQSVREAEGEGCSPSRRELPQQLAEQLGAYLSQLPCPGPQAERFMHHLWCASEGVGILRQALSEIQEARQPTTSETQSASRTMCVRRLTATECEFLQGFPRNYTLIPWRKKTAEDCPDGPRYKALGNSMAVNVMAWIGKRIDNYERTRNAVRTEG
jgi:hypothetical protein